MQYTLFNEKIKKENIPEDKIILLDLNYTLVANSGKCFGGYPQRIYQQKYELDLINKIKYNYVIIITARPEVFKDKTLRHIKKQTGFVPDESYWNTGVGNKGMSPPKLKEMHLHKNIFPKHGKDYSRYLAIESNILTRAMYKKYKIYAQPKSKFI